MTTITDEELHLHAHRAKGKVVIITGGANGFGKETALRFGRYGANVVIGDLDVPGAEKVVAEIIQLGGQGAAQRCDVLSWDDQVSLFELAYSKYGSIDVVIPNAGVSEIGAFAHPQVVDGKPSKPVLKTIDINLTSVLYTTHLALFYLKKNFAKGSLKAIIFLGSMASWQAIGGAPMYSASKHALLGVMRSLYPACLESDIRVGIVHPFFADTAIVPTAVKVFLAGIPLTPVQRVAGAIFCAVTDPDMETSGCPWLLPDGGNVFRLEREHLKEGVYKRIDDRTRTVTGAVQNVKQALATVRDLTRILGKQVLVIGVVTAGASYLYRNEDVTGFVQYHADALVDRISVVVHDMLQ